MTDASMQVADRAPAGDPNGQPVTCEVRQLALSDIPELARLLDENREHITPFLSQPPAAAADLVRNLTGAVIADQQGRSWHGVVHVSGELAGAVWLVRLPAEVLTGCRQSADDVPAADEANTALGEHPVEVMTWIAQSWVGRGVGRAALSQVCDIGFGKLHLPRIHARVRRENEPSLRMVRAAGFHAAGIPAADGPTESSWQVLCRDA